MAELDALLRQLKDRGGSDLHMMAGLRPRMRLQGRLVEVEEHAVLSDDGLRKLLQEVVSADRWSDYVASGDLDFSYGLEGTARFRANYFVQQHGAAGVFRIIPEKITPLEDLDLPPAIESFAHETKGLVLVTGPTGSGKSTTLAGIIDKINRTYRRHVLTLEDPLEFVHENRESVFSHREIGAHTKDFGPGLRAAIRQDADVVLVGELRDPVTISLAITAAEMGMLVFGTLHTNSAPKSIDRIIDSFPADGQSQVRTSLAASLAGIVSQLLLPTPDGKDRRAANEILIKTGALPNLIREGNMSMLTSFIQSGKNLGMQTMDDSLFGLATRGEVLPRDAYLKATDKARFEPLLEGG